MEIQILTDADSVSEFIKMVDYLEKLGYKQIMESSSTTHYYALLKRANAKSNNKSYNGVKKFRNIKTIFGVKFVIDND